MSIAITDPTFVKKEQLGAFDQFALKFIRDERDLPFIYLILRITFILIPIGISMFVLDAFGLFRLWMAIPYWALLFGAFFDRYILMLHNTSHRPLWKREYNFMKSYIPWVLAPFCGQTPETYYVHHITMHHAEGNLPKDLSSTMKYQRDSVFGFLHYFFDFFFFSLFKLGRYQASKKRFPILRRMILGEFSFYAAVAVGLWLAPGPTMVVFVTPFLLARFLMMCGNWGQHAFIDSNDPGNSYRNSITCINVDYNRRCFNDGYHIGHHVTANRHWTDMPADFLANKDKYVQYDSVVFQGVDFFMVWFFLMLGRYDVLVKHFVDLRDEKRSPQEIEDLLRSRVQQIDVEQDVALKAVPY